MVWTILVPGIFLPSVVLAWLCYQAILATHVASVAPPNRTWARRLLALSIPATVAVLVTQVTLVRITDDSGLPEVYEGEWVLVNSLPQESLPGLGQSVVVACPDEGFSVARVVGLPGDRIFLMGARVCRNDQCFPVAPLLEEDQAGGVSELEMEVVGSRDHLVLPAQGGATDSWRSSLPVEVSRERVAVLPDHRGSQGFGQCTGGVIVLPLERVVGLTGTIAIGRSWSRFGLTVQ